MCKLSLLNKERSIFSMSSTFTNLCHVSLFLGKFTFLCFFKKPVCNSGTEGWCYTSKWSSESEESSFCRSMPSSSLITALSSDWVRSLGSSFSCWRTLVWSSPSSSLTTSGVSELLQPLPRQLPHGFFFFFFLIKKIIYY